MQAYLDKLNELIGQKNADLLVSYGTAFFNRWDMMDIGGLIILTTDVVTENGYLSLMITYDPEAISAMSTVDQEAKAEVDFAAAVATLP